MGCWKHSENGIFKLNTNGAIFCDLQATCMGAILKDSSGDVLMAASIWGSDLQNSKITECLALFKGLQLCLNLEINHLIVESNYHNLVTNLQSIKESSSLLGNIIQDLNGLMTRFEVCSIHFTYRQSNVTVHKLARYACNIEHIVLWYTVTPKFLSSTICFEKSCSIELAI